MKLIWFVLLLLALPVEAAANPVSAQFCNPAVVYYLVRDANGQPLSAAELKAVFAQLPESIGGANPYPGEVAFQADGKSYYRREQVEWKQGRKVPALEFANAATCEMTLAEVTLTYRHQQMRLRFNLSVIRGVTNNRIVVDALPFQAGTFTLDPSGLSLRDNVLIPAERWKPVREKAVEHTPSSHPNEPKKRRPHARRNPKKIFFSPDPVLSTFPRVLVKTINGNGPEPVSNPGCGSERARRKS